jgi:hypothetical protein
MNLPSFLLGLVAGFSSLFFIASVMTSEKVYTFMFAAVLIFASFLIGVTKKEGRK